MSTKAKARSQSAWQEAREQIERAAAAKKVAGGIAAFVWNIRVAGSSTEARTANLASPAREPALAGVDELMRNVDRYGSGLVRVKGEIREDGGKLVFVARSVEKVERGGTR